MKLIQSYPKEFKPTVQEAIRSRAAEYDHICLLDGSANKIDDYEFIYAIGANQIISPLSDAFQTLATEIEKKKKWLFGYFAYDLKQETDGLSSNNFDGIAHDNLFFFHPQLLFLGFSDRIELHAATDKFDAHQFFNFTKQQANVSALLHFKARISKDQYLKTIKEIKQHIARGDIYEMNFCQEFYMENALVNPIDLYTELSIISPTPFASYLKTVDKHLICASPERYLKKKGNTVLSQPIKGTARRDSAPLKDKEIKERLRSSLKDQTENVMIVDLVRNDLSRIALRNSVKVDELFGIYSFKHVHQMISTVSCLVDNGENPVQFIKSTFPMGSMTGAPKISAMELIERYESTKRGLFSGAVGYFDPSGDFDFNVVIRSLLYNASKEYLSVQVGGAITSNSIPEEEYEESLLKATAIFEIGKNKTYG